MRRTRSDQTCSTSPAKARHRAPKNSAGRHRGSTKTSVWACADEDPVAGTGLLANWLLNAVIKVVTRYSAPGDRVLLLFPSPMVTSRRGRQYRGLSEAVWPVVRLGRGARVEDLGPYDPADRGSSGTSDTALVITAADPWSLALTRPTRWRPVLASGGLFAVITHADTTGQRLNDPTGMLVRTASEDGLRYLDRIALVQVPMAEVRAGRPKPAVANVSVRAHTDLHMFTVDGGHR